MNFDFKEKHSQIKSVREDTPSKFKNTNYKSTSLENLERNSRTRPIREIYNYTNEFSTNIDKIEHHHTDKCCLFTSCCTYGNKYAELEKSASDVTEKAEISHAKDDAFAPPEKKVINPMNVEDVPPARGKDGYTVFGNPTDVAVDPPEQVAVVPSKMEIDHSSEVAVVPLKKGKRGYTGFVNPTDVAVAPPENLTENEVAVVPSKKGKGGYTEFVNQTGLVNADPKSISNEFKKNPHKVHMIFDRVEHLPISSLARRSNVNKFADKVFVFSEAKFSLKNRKELIDAHFCVKNKMYALLIDWDPETIQGDEEQMTLEIQMTKLYKHTL